MNLEDIFFDGGRWGYFDPDAPSHQARPPVSVDQLSLIKRIHEARDTIAALFEQIDKGELFKAGFGPIFAKHPKLYSVSFHGYTPSFNDGDPCYFRSNHDDFEINEDDPGDFEGDGDMSVKEREAASEDVSEFLNIFTDDDMESIFGDGFKVVVSRTGLDISEYGDY